ncbi:NAD(P)/FAD-dependent oxidoreductase [Novosphingobium sp. 11B]
MTRRIGIVGAGVAGLACAQRLRGTGEIVLVDKGRRPGGRLTTVRIGTSSWDLGTPSFTAFDPQFRAEVMRWQDAGWVARWNDGPPDAVVGMPSMATLVAEQSRQLDVRFDFRVQSLSRGDSGWMIEGEGCQAGPFDSVVIAVPAEQAAPLLSLHDLDAARYAASVRSSSCWAVMAEFQHPLAIPMNFATDFGIFSMVANNRSKPARGEAECWVLHANARWSHEHLEHAASDIAAQLLKAFAAAIESDLPPLSFVKAHRWRFSRPCGQSGKVIWNPTLQLGACGDWCTEPTVEGAWLSGVQLAERIKTTLTDGTALDLVRGFRHAR